MLTFLLGRSGSGKTNHILNEIECLVKQGKKTYLLVPEQQVYISECMLADLPSSSALCFEVVSFSRLCEIVFAKFGGIADRGVGMGSRNLIMWHTLRELSPFLRQYKGTKVDSSFTSMMLSVCDELHANKVTPEMCEEISARCENRELSDKLSDISAVYADFLRNIEELLGESAFAAENKLSRLADILAENAFFSECNIFIDSFTSFTGEEHDILEKIISQADNTIISFTYERGSAAPHFESISYTVKKLTRYAKDNEIDHRDIFLDSHTRTDKRELVLLEQNLWNFSITEKNKPILSEDDFGSIEMAVCANEYEEMWLAGLNILKEHAQGKKFSEIALIARDIESRKGIIDAVFEQLSIPYFFSERTDLSSTAPARLILSALRCISHNFNTVDVLTLLKTGLLGIDSRDADLFEDYVKTWNISGELFTASAWSMNPDGYKAEMSERGKVILEAANSVRSLIIPPLAELRNKFNISGHNTRENCRALYEYLEAVSLSDNLSLYAETALSSGDLKGAGEILRLYDFLVSMLADISTVLAESETTSEELAFAIEIMLRNTDIGSVPMMSDYVTVGSASTLRVENIKTAILLGLSEGEFPANYSDSGILSENDKQRMEALGISLTSREDSVTSDELFHAYRAMSRPSEKLILSTCKASVGGRALNPSSAWNRVLFLFPHIKVEKFDLGTIRAISDKAQKDIPQNDEGMACTEHPADSDDIETVDPFYVRMLFGDTLRLSKSKISSFAQCPYRFWSEYILDLREQNVSAVNYVDSGTLIHYILENAINELRLSDGSLKEVSDPELIAMTDKHLSEYINKINCPLPPSMMYEFSRLRDMALLMVKSVTDEFKSSLFRVLASEKPISEKKPEALRPIEIKLDDSNSSPSVILSGIIDRIDCYEGADRRYIRIVDYKTGAHKFDADKISSGEDLQLPAYLFTVALEQNKDLFGSGGDKELFPASALFLSANDSSGRITADRSGFILKDEELLHAASQTMDPTVLAGIKKNKNGEITGRSAISEEGILNINDILRQTISQTAKDMYSGRIPRTPSLEACAYCRAKSICRKANKNCF